MGKPAPERLNQSGWWWGGTGIIYSSVQTTTLEPYHLIFTGRMLFLTPNQ